GAFLMVVGATRSRHSITSEEARVVADEYNQKLREKLGLPDEEMTYYQVPEEPEMDWAIAPAITPSGSGLVFSLSF
ncbi:hypothetical protein KAI87_13390, partial [Myxococcota bacterium]|nr:hypothetical protein [Myxococcota bacterium]